MCLLFDRLYITSSVVLWFFFIYLYVCIVLICGSCVCIIRSEKVVGGLITVLVSA